MAETTSVDAATAVKRRRVDGVEEPMQAAGAPSEKYRSLWLEDGNIVLQCAEGAFRVHRSLLVAQSEVFRDMFDLATPTTDLGNSTPVVHLSDNTEQMYTFLRSLMFHDDPLQNSVVYTDQILDMIELSRKYSVPLMRRAYIDILRGLFPDTLQAYQLTIEKRAKLVSFRAGLRCLMAATTHNLPTLLPACYLFIADRFYGEVFDVKKAGCWPSDIPFSVYSNVVRNMRQLLLLKRKVIDCFAEDWHHDYVEDTAHRHQVAILLQYFGSRNRVGEFYEEDLAIFQPEWMATDISRSIFEDLCDECIAKWDNSQRQAWVEGWDMLPSYLSMQSWETIQQQENQAPTGP